MSFAHSSESEVVQRAHSERTVGVCSCVCLEIIVGGLREGERDSKKQSTVNVSCHTLLSVCLVWFLRGGFTPSV